MQKNKNVHNRAEAILTVLKSTYPERKTLLKYSRDVELMAGVILSAQCTDAMVNRILPKLFDRYNNWKDLAEANLSELEQIIRPAGFYHNKAVNIKNAAKMVLEKCEGILPSEIEKLVQLPGIGRKSANVIVSALYGKPGIIVDTHFKRVLLRLKLVESATPEKIEIQVANLLSPDSWTDFSMAINFHGRYRCYSRKPDCNNCEILSYCPYGKEKVGDAFSESP